MGLGEQLLKRVSPLKLNLISAFQKFEERSDDRMRQVSGHSMKLHGGRPGKLRTRRLSSSDGMFFVYPHTS